MDVLSQYTERGDSVEHNQVATVPDGILQRIRRCGYFLHFKTGGRSGRRRIFFMLSKWGELRQRELQDMLGIQSGSLSEVVIKMEADGLIEKVRSQADGRQMVLRLTEAGQRQAQAVREEYLQRAEEMLSCFPPEQQVELLAMLDTLTDHWTVLESSWADLPPRDCGGCGKPDCHV